VCSSDLALARVILATQPARLTELVSSKWLAAGDEAFILAFDLMREAKAAGREFSATEREALAVAQLRLPLQNGWLQYAAEQWLTLPEATRATLRARALPATSWRHTSDGTSYVEEGDLRSRLVFALALAGATDEAGTFARGALDAGWHDHMSADELAAQAVALMLDAGSVDAWEVAVSLKTSSAQPEVFAGVARLASPYEDLLAEETEWLLRNDTSTRGVTAGAIQGVSAAHERAMARLWSAGAFMRPDAGTSGTRTSDAGVIDLAPPPWPYVEGSWRGAAPQVKSPPELPGFWPVRAERSGGRTVVLALSSRFDPTGEVSMGGYWLLLSEGERWQAVYLGFSDHRPFHAWARSRVPLLDAHDVVRLDVAQAAIQDRTIRFPPLATAAPVTRAHVVLEAPLSELLKDTDGDGLSDLTEARLLMNPRSTDTDGDGVPDGDDSMPRLDNRLPSTPRTAPQIGRAHV
jgi:hypothetical protein